MAAHVAPPAMPMRQSIPYGMLAGLLCLAATLHADTFNFSPRSTQTFVEGPNIPRDYFTRGGDKVSFKCPEGMRVSGSPDKAVFTFEKIVGAEFTISHSYLSPNDPFSMEGKIDLRYTALAQKQIPSGARGIRHLEVKRDVFGINGWSSIQYHFAYSYGNRDFRCAVTILNYDDQEQLVMVMRSPPEEFDQVYARSKRLLNTFHVLTPGEEAKPDPFS